jgi:hypothetical protein
MLVAAGLAGVGDHALISLLALNELRLSEAIGADIEDLGLERSPRTLTILRKGGKVVTVPLAPRTARAVDLAVGERCGGPIFIGTDGARIDRHAAGRIVRRIARRAGIAKRVGPPHLASRIHHRRARRWRSPPRRSGRRALCAGVASSDGLATAHHEAQRWCLCRLVAARRRGTFRHTSQLAGRTLRRAEQPLPDPVRLAVVPDTDRRHLVARDRRVDRGGHGLVQRAADPDVLAGLAFAPP